MSLYSTCASMMMLMMLVLTSSLVSCEEKKGAGGGMTGGVDYQRGRGLIGDVGVQGDYHFTPNDRLTGGGSVSKVLIGPGHREDPSVSGRVGYQHEDPRGHFGGGVEYQRGLGAIASVGADYNLHSTKDSTLNFRGEAARGISGPARGMKPNYGAYLEYNRRFKREQQQQPSFF